MTPVSLFCDVLMMSTVPFIFATYAYAPFGAIETASGAKLTFRAIVPAVDC